MKIKITKKSGGWIQGDIGEEHTFEAKIFDEPSKHGINNGRISKLTIRDEDGDMVVNYDRYWDVEPESGYERELVKLLVNKFD